MLARDQRWSILLDKTQNAFGHDRSGVLARHGQHIFAVDFGLNTGSAQDGVQVLLDEIGLALLDYHHAALIGAEALYLIFDQRISNVQNVERNPAVAKSVRQAQQL